jgi:hypothetical protein
MRRRARALRRHSNAALVGAFTRGGIPRVSTRTGSGLGRVLVLILFLLFVFLTVLAGPEVWGEVFTAYPHW